MFLLNLGFRWTLTDEVEGVIFLPAGSSCARLLRARQQEFKRALLDPQLYLAGLEAADCRLVCARLASYPWFCVPGLPEFDSGSMKRREWDKEMHERVVECWPAQPPSEETVIQEACLSAIDIQLSMSCTQIILPAPLITEREDEAQVQALWLDRALEVAQELEVGQPLLATIALDEGVLNDATFSPAGFLDAIVDQISARDGLEGVYIVIAQHESRHPFETSEHVQHAYLHLSQAFGARGYGTVITNFADVFGLVCLGVGATSCAAGPSQALRRLSLAAFREEGGGKALPRFYSHRVVAELATESDLEKISRRLLLRRVMDRTPHSATLMDTLLRGGSAAQLPAWAESQNNIATAHRHFIARLALEEGSLRSLGSTEKQDRIREWLENAAANSLYIQRRLGDEELAGAFAPTLAWLDLLDKVTNL